MRLYLAGPMRGIPFTNFPAFHDAAHHLRGDGHEVWSPVEQDEKLGLTPEMSAARSIGECMATDLPEVCRAEAVAVLPGWRESEGARIETFVAKACGIPIVDALTLEPIEETCLEEAQRLVYGARGHDYGHPLDDFTRTATMWSVLLGVPVTAELVAMCMVCVKLSREINRPRRDNRVDIAGYADCLDQVVTERARREALR
jgi:hypothetical protein